MVIERSIDGIRFEKIGEQMAFNQKESHYIYTDRTILSGKFYYFRLKMLEEDGTYQFSKRIFVETKNTDNAIQIYPNPTTGYVYIKGAISPIQKYKIQSMNGITIATSHLKEDRKIDMSSLPNGIYILSFTRRIVKMN